MNNVNLSQIVKELSESCLCANEEYMKKRIEDIVKGSMKENMEIHDDVAKLIGCAAGASTVVAVELSTIILVNALAELGLIEHDGHPNISIVKKGNTNL